MKSKFYQKFLAPVALALCAATAPAATIDYSDLSNWTSSGDFVGLSGGNFATLTNASASFEDDAPKGDGALNRSGSEPTATFGDLETFLGISVGALDADFLNQATEGSAIKMTLNVQAGDILTINWQMRTNDVAGDFVGGMDLFFLTVNDSVFRLGTSSDALQASTGNYSFETGAKQSTYTFNAAGTYTIGLGVVDMTDYANSSELVLDGVSVTAVPEPSTYALVLGSLGVFVLVSRRRGKLSA